MAYLSEPHILINGRQTFEGDPGAAQSKFEQGLDECASAFLRWEAALHRTDQQLYQAIGQTYILKTLIGDDYDLVARAARGRGIKATKSSTIYTLITKLVFAQDRQKASKYAGVLKFLDSRLPEPEVDMVSYCIKAEGGIEACLRKFRKEERQNALATNPSRALSLCKTTEQLTNLPKCAPPSDLKLDADQGAYFLLVGVCDEQLVAGFDGSRRGSL
jgi:hypothetical protein